MTTSQHNPSDSGIMLLDIGNTNLKWTWLQNNRPGKISSVPHKGQELEQLAASAWADMATPGQTYVSNVAGAEIERDLREWIEQHWGHAPRFVQATAGACGVSNSYRQPERLGVDRWLTLIALHTMFPGPVCVVDCGTAVTIDVLGLDGAHQGGLILPGFGLMQQALLQHTAIPYNGDIEPAGLLATDTESAIAAGGVNAVAALVERVQQRVAKELGAAVTVVLTGSDAERLQPLLSIQSMIAMDLVMQGLIEFINNEPEQ
jgi:type III pantothenate kinase